MASVMQGRAAGGWRGETLPRVPLYRNFRGFTVNRCCSTCTARGGEPSVLHIHWGGTIPTQALVPFSCFKCGTTQQKLPILSSEVYSTKPSSLVRTIRLTSHQHRAPTSSNRCWLSRGHIVEAGPPGSWMLNAESAPGQVLLQESNI
jgi:hypothetical protein